MKLDMASWAAWSLEACSRVPWVCFRASDWASGSPYFMSVTETRFLPSREVKREDS